MTKIKYLLLALVFSSIFNSSLLAQSSSVQTVLIDVAHGGEDQGRLGVLEAKESEVLLAISDELREVAKDREGIKLIFLRAEDKLLSLAEREKIISAQPLALLVSIHLGVSSFHTESGISVYYCAPTSVADDLVFIAEEEKFFTNAPLDCQGEEVRDKLFAQQLEGELTKNLKLYYDGVQSSGVKKAPWAILKTTKQPAAVVLLSSLDHPVEGRRLMDRRYRRVLATSLYQSIEKYLQK
ncbi:MAG: N-acetylmuramoyl-L-alanine amidase [Deltaproteobacteria bacterium]|nr:N-acetylmuramoyl-L-alanine amidase [Deltaproteobacteria bacterium]